MDSLREPPLVAPDEIRAARRANGWSVEQMADLFCVSPLEVGAWEAGSISPSRLDSDWIRWHAVMAVRDRAYGPGGIQPCTWVMDQRARAAAQRDSGSGAGRERRGAHPSDLDWPYLAKHASGCEACRRAAGLDAALPPLPPEPATNALGRLWRRVKALPGPAVAAARLAVAGTAGAVLGGLIGIVQWLQEPSQGFSLSSTPVLVLLAGTVAFLLLDRPLRDAASRHPHGVQRVRALGVLAGMLGTWAALSGVDQFLDSWYGIFAAIGSFLLIKGVSDARTQMREERLAREARPWGKLMPPNPLDAVAARHGDAVEGNVARRPS